jgi:hypothetical protein
VGYLPYSFGCEDLEISSDFDRAAGEKCRYLTRDPEGSVEIGGNLKVFAAEGIR